MTNQFQHTMDGFLVNPSMPYKTRRHDAYHAEPLVAPFESIKWMPGQFPSEGLFDLRNDSPVPRKYASSEDDSPNRGSDTASPSPSLESESDSTFSDVASLSDSLFDGFDDEICDYAHAVTVIAVGKAKVVSLPPSPTSPRFSGIERSKSPTYKRMSYAERRSSLIATPDSMKARQPTYPGHLATEVDMGRRPSLPVHLLPSDLAAVQSVPPRVPDKSSNPPLSLKTFLDRDPYPSAMSPDRPGTPTPLSRHRPTSSRSRNPSQLLIGRLSKTFDATKRRPVAFPPAEERLPSPQLTRKPKLVARGADERAPTISIPPCPHDYEPQLDLPETWFTSRRRAMTGDRASNERKHLSLTLPGSGW